MRGTTGMTITDGGAKQPGDIGRVRRAGCVQIVVQVIAGAVEKQADVQGLATRRQDPATRCQAKGILIVSLSLAMAMDILLDLHRPAWQTTLQRERRWIPDIGMFYFGHD
ncbi:hypothetical protein ALQ07_200112 [Pseudomonas syringae pv. actinidiae]|uniref:Uncharacterized protein n=1 Tax=Pseudomonas syringae pv. actinidiae TaxID=103796 RepID=A0A3M4KTV4_PSESF|nr:hypothetical protein ALQ07_200112 [Pseudomonas syringae pv. actinidiae]